MPKLKYKASRDIPNAVRQLHTFSPSVIREWILSRFNKAVTTQSISMWLSRNPDVKKQLEDDIVREEFPLEEVRESMFISGTFEVLPSVDNWIRKHRRKATEKGRKKREKYIKSSVSALKRFCKGVMPLTNPETQRVYTKEDRKELKRADLRATGIDLKKHGWVLKHPDRITEDDVYEYLDLLAKYYPKVDTSSMRIPLRSFLLSKGRDVDEIVGDKHQSAGKYARLYLPIDILYDIFDYIKLINYEIYVVDNFMFLTATRISATLKAKVENIFEVDDSHFITVYDKGDSKLYGDEGHPWDKFLTPSLLEEIKLLTGYPDNVSGNIFEVKAIEVSAMNREAYNEVYPQLLERYPTLDINHFWRHIFAQHYLRVTGWNYGVVANMGGWDTKSLEESYGKPPIEEVRKWGVKIIPELTRGANQVLVL